MGDFKDYSEPEKDVIPKCQSDIDTATRYINIVKSGTITPTETHYLDNAINLLLKVRANIEEI